MNDQSVVFEVTPQSFQEDVVARSRQVPVLILFWTDQVPPAADTKRILETLVGQYQGKVLLGLVDVARDPTLAQSLRVQGVPSIRVVRDGQLVHQVDGPQPESALRGMLDELTMSPSDQLQDQLQLLLDRGDFDTALQLLEQAINEEPKNQLFRVELADVLVRQGKLEDAETVLAGIPDDTDGAERPRARLEFAQEAAGLAELADLVERNRQDPEDLEIRYQLAVRCVSLGDFESALEHAMAILQRDRAFRDDIGRTTMIRIFAVLGKGSELASRYRRRMFALMH